MIKFKINELIEKEASLENVIKLFNLGYLYTKY